MTEQQKRIDHVKEQTATIGEKLSALRKSIGMTVTALSRASGVSERSIRYFERGERTPRVDAIKKLAAALEVGTDYFLDDDILEEQLHNEEFLARAKERYGSRGMAQGRAILEQAQAFYAGGNLSEDERLAFRDEMEAIFWDSKEDAKKYTPKKHRS